MRRPGGSTLTAQQPENNIVRVAIQALSAVAGGAQSIHTNSFDEALALPTEHSARIALRTQQLLAHEAGGTDTADPLGGAYFIETLTDELERGARELIERVDEIGGAVEAIEQGFVQREIEDAAFRHNSAVESGEKVIVGVNSYREETVGADRAAPARSRGREAPARADGEGTGRAERRRGGEGRGRGAPGGRGRGEPPAADARGSPRSSHDRRDLQRATGRIRYIRLTAKPVLISRENPEEYSLATGVNCLYRHCFIPSRGREEV